MSLSKIDRQAFRASQALEEAAKSIYYGRVTVLRLEPVNWLSLSFAVREQYCNLAKAAIFLESPAEFAGSSAPPVKQQPQDYFNVAAAGARTIATRLRETHGFDAYIGPPTPPKAS